MPFVHFLRQQYGVILSISLLSIVLGVTYLVVARPSYTAVATMLIDPRIVPLTSGGSLIESAIESQVIVLNSDDLAISVIKKTAAERRCRIHWIGLDLQIGLEKFARSQTPSYARAEYL